MNQKISYNWGFQLQKSTDRVFLLGREFCFFPKDIGSGACNFCKLHYEGAEPTRRLAANYLVILILYNLLIKLIKTNTKKQFIVNYDLIFVKQISVTIF